MSARSTLASSTSPFANLSRQPSAAESDDEQKKKDDEAKAKKAKADEEDDDMEDEEQDKDARAARRRERARCAAIFSSPHAAVNLEATAHLAFGTTMPRGAAISLLAAMNAGKSNQPAAAAEPRRDDLRNRMAEVPNPVVGSEGTRTAPSLADQILAADKKRRGEA